MGTLHTCTHLWFMWASLQMAVSHVDDLAGSCAVCEEEGCQQSAAAGVLPPQLELAGFEQRHTDNLHNTATMVLT